VYPDKKPMNAQSWPAIEKKLIDKEALTEMQKMIDLITAVRNLRASWNIAPAERISCLLASNKKEELQLLQDNKAIIKRLAGIKDVSVDGKLNATKNVATAIIGTIQCALPLGDVIDIEKEKKRILLQIEEQKKHHSGIAKRLENKSFLEKAPKEVVEKEQQRMEELQNKSEELEKVIANIQ